MYKTKAKIELPYEFISPYPPDECAERLHMKRGNYLGTSIEVQIEPQEFKGYRFQMQVFRKGDRNQSTVDLGINGLLENVKKVGTHVRIEREESRPWITVRALLGSAVSTLITFIVLHQFLRSEPSALAGIVLATFLVCALTMSAALSGRKEGLEEVIQLLEETLIPRDENLLPDDNSISSKLIRLKALLHTEKPKRG